MPKVIPFPSSSPVLPTVENKVDPLKLFRFHGVTDLSPGEEQARGACPFCGKENRFHVNIKSGLWDCKVCGEKGNPLQFLRTLHRMSVVATTEEEYQELATERNLCYGETVKEWGCAKSILTGEWLVPAFDPSGKIRQLYRYVQVKGKRVLYASPGMGSWLYGAHLYDPRKPSVYLLEGPWDGMAIYEMLKTSKRVDDFTLSITGNSKSSLLADVNVMASPGCASFSEQWCPLFDKKLVALMFDSDHPVIRGGNTIPPAGFVGMQRAANAMTYSGNGVPTSVEWLAWGIDGFAPREKSGTDVRDVLTGGDAKNTPSSRLENLQSILTKLEFIPDEWVAGRKKESGGKLDVEAIPCTEWKPLVTAWRKAFKWGEGLDRALSVMLASLASTNSIGDQLWVKIIGPASCGKSTLCEALSINRRHVVAKSTIRGFHSGFQTDKDGAEDNSLLKQLNGKCFIIKDGDTLLQSPNLPQILSEARDIYDRVSRTSYRNKASREYLGVSMTWLLCGTSSLRSLDSSELGERFLDCVIMEGIDHDAEKDIIMRVLNRQDRVKGTPVADAGAALNEPDLTHAMQLTSGYIDYLGMNANPLLSSIVSTPDQLEHLYNLAVFVANLRARPSSRQVETVERELGARLASQLHRLSTCLAVVLNRSTLDAEVMRRTTCCAMDTARGKTLETCRKLYEHRDTGLEVKALSLLTGSGEGEERTLLKFLKKLDVVDHRITKIAGVSSKIRWYLTPRMEQLFKDLLYPEVGTAEQPS